MTRDFGLIIEGLVSALLLLTIIYCSVLNRRLKKLKADEHALKATISELITATEIAERAIAGLKLTVRECDQGLGERLHAGESLARELDRQLKSGREILDHLVQIAAARAQPAPPPRPVEQPAAPPTVQQTAVAASAFAARARQRPASAAA